MNSFKSLWHCKPYSFEIVSTLCKVLNSTYCLTGNNIGDVCETDYDGDGTIDNDDICPNSNLYQVTDFATDFLSVELYPTLTDATSPIWIVTDTVSNKTFNQKFTLKGTGGLHAW